MTANTGRTHPKHLEFWLDDSGGTLTNLSAYLDSTGTFGLNYEEQDVTGMSNAIKNIVIGRPEAPLTIVFKFDTVVFAHLNAIDGVNTPLSLDIRMGIRHAWESGEPTFGISSSATSGYLCTGVTIDPSAGTITAKFNVFGPTAPDMATTAHT